MRMRPSKALGLGIFPLLSACMGIVGCSADRGEPQENGSAVIGSAQDATGLGPLATTSSEYRFPAAVDPDVLGDRPTEIWASVFRPTELTAEPHPVLVFLHGNHGTCGRGSAPRIDDNVAYTTSGTCPDGYTVVPNHRGYDYIASRLASWGYVVVSINANRGITAGEGVDGDDGLNLARGRLVLKHLALLSGWNRDAGTTPPSLGVDLAGKLDFTEVGLMGHSRGGEGVRAAYAQYSDPGTIWPTKIGAPLNVRGIFEVGPVDGQTDRVLDALGTAWNVLLPMCDGDVFDLQGMMPFDRMMRATKESTPSAKSMFAVWGANHNYYNTEWQQNDSEACTGPGNTPLFQTAAAGSTKQQATGLHAMMSFFRAHVGRDKNATLAQTFDPEYAVPETLTAITRVERAYAGAIDSEHAITVEDFTGKTGQSRAGVPVVANNVSVDFTGVAEHHWDLKAADIAWSAAGPNTNFRVDWAGEGQGLDVRAMGTFDFRISRKPFATNPDTPTNFSIQLVHDDGSLSQPVHLRDYIELGEPAGGGPWYGPVCSGDYCHGWAAHPARHVILDTVRIPLGDFGQSKLSAVRGVRLVFDDSPVGSLYLTDVRFSKTTPPGTRPVAGNGAPLGPDPQVKAGGPISANNQVTSMRQATADSPLEIELRSDHAFPVADELARLRIGDRDVVVSRYVDDGDTHRIIFKMTPAQLAAAQDGAPMTVRYGRQAAAIEYDFGTFRKGNVNR